jgi:ATP synthase protein I
MGDNPTEAPQGKRSSFSDQVGVKAARKLKGLRSHQPGVWFGLGMSGLIGWSVAIPTFLGASLGIWWDRRHPGGHSWTLALLAAGLVVGCVNAWHWMTLEDKAMHDDPEARDE